MRNHHCTIIKPQVSIILGYAIERQLAKSHGGWKSNTVAEGYFEESIQNKIEISNIILNSVQKKQHTN